MTQPDNESIPQLIVRLVADGRNYARTEAAYYRALAKERATAAGMAAMLGGAALFVALAVLTATLVGILLLLAQAVGYGWATLILLVAGLVVAGLLARAAIAQARAVTASTDQQER